MTALALLALLSAPLVVESKAAIEFPRAEGRPLSLRATYPTTGGPYPVIVFSHGMYGSETGADPLVQHWAKAGYVVLQPTHLDSLRYADQETRRRALQGSLDNVGSWETRPTDIRIVLDNLKILPQKVPALKGKIDASRIAMAGHSFGAWTTQVVAGMTLRRGGQTLDLSDPRPKAFVAISPHGIGGGVSAESFTTMRSPMLYISGDNDRGRFEGEPAVYRRQAFQHSPAGNRVEVWIEGAHHGFGGINGRAANNFTRNAGLSGPANPQHVRWVQESALQFFNLHLKADPAARAFWANPFAGEKGVTVTQK